MRRPAAPLVTTLSALGVVLGSLLAAPQLLAAEEKSVIEQGKAIAYDRALGNCLACHQMEGGELPGNIGPPLVAMKARFPDKTKLRAQVWDSTKNNPNSMMPPFGRHSILTEEELDKVVEYIYTL